MLMHEQGVPLMTYDRVLMARIREGHHGPAISPPLAADSAWVFGLGHETFAGFAIGGRSLRRSP
jgi:hypothetical protein